MQVETRLNEHNKLSGSTPNDRHIYSFYILKDNFIHHPAFSYDTCICEQNAQHQSTSAHTGPVQLTAVIYQCIGETVRHTFDVLLVL